jgi:hypothetical protein
MVPESSAIARSGYPSLLKSPETIPAAFEPRVGNVFALVAVACCPVTTTACVLDELVAYVVVAWNTAFTLVVPGAKVRRSVAVPLLVTHTVPSTALSSQNEAVAVQNTTCPDARGVPPEVTVAVNVITAPAVVLAGETARVVEVRFAASAAVERKRTLMIKNTGIRENAERLRRLFLCVVTRCMKVMMELPYNQSKRLGWTCANKQAKEIALHTNGLWMGPLYKQPTREFVRRQQTGTSTTNLL